MFKKLLPISFIFLLAFLIAPISAEAQLAEVLNQSINFSIRPERPKPYDTVIVYMESYSIDLQSSEISWFVDGELKKREVGSKNLTFEVGGLGSISNVTAVIQTYDGGVFKKSLNIRPADVDMIWESESYTPPFYKGKSRFSYQGDLKVVAIPSIIREDGTKVPAKSLLYTWKKDGRVMADQSGYGLNTFKTSGSVPIRSTTIEVEVSTTDSLYVAGSSISINPERPNLIIYENNPVYGILFNRSLGTSLPVSKDELVLSAVPYFFDVVGKDGKNLDYKWVLGGEENREFGSNIVLRRVGDQGGKTSVSLRVSNTDKIFQFADASLNIVLPAKETGNGFFNN